jgi:hypothetical protein
MKRSELEQKVAELEFKLKALQNFVFEHHHILVHQGLKSDETSQPNGRKEEPLNKPKQTKKEEHKDGKPHTYT